MNSRSNVALLALILGLFVTQSSVFAQDGAAAPVKTKQSTQSDEIVFPIVDGWEKGDVQNYPVAELGYSVPYRSDDGDVITIYVYNAGVKNIPDTLDHKAIKGQMKQAKFDVFAMVEAGYYKNVREIKNETITLGGSSGKVKALYALLEFTARDVGSDSEIYLFPYRGNFIKIRATRPKTDGAVRSPEFLDLLAVLDAMFSN